MLQKTHYFAKLDTSHFKLDLQYLHSLLISALVHIHTGANTASPFRDAMFINSQSIASQQDTTLNTPHKSSRRLFFFNLLIQGFGSTQ